MKPNANIIQWTRTKRPTTTRREPSLTIHLLNLSFMLKSLGASPLTSPDNNIRISGVDLDRSDIVDKCDIDEFGEPRFDLASGDLMSSM